MSLRGFLFGKDARELDERVRQRVDALEAERAEIDASDTYTTKYLWPAAMCLRCGAVAPDRELHDRWHAESGEDYTP